MTATNVVLCPKNLADAATSEATADRLIRRNSAGSAKVATPPLIPGTDYSNEQIMNYWIVKTMCFNLYNGVMDNLNSLTAAINALPIINSNPFISVSMLCTATAITALTFTRLDGTTMSIAAGSNGGSTGGSTGGGGNSNHLPPPYERDVNSETSWL
jgi:uncharacterized membrane protein YgcG